MNFSSSSKKILSNTEHQVLELISRGCSPEEISVMLMLSTDSIELLQRSINKKLEINDTMDAVFKARRLNLI